MAKRSAVVLDETLIGQRPLAELAIETIRMPAIVQRLDYATDDKLATLSTTGRKKYLKIVLAILAAAEFVIDFCLIKWLKTLSANKTMLMQDFTIRVDDFLLLFEAFVAMRTK